MHIHTWLNGLNKMEKNYQVSLIEYNIHGFNEGKYTYASQGEIDDKQKENIMINLGSELSGNEDKLYYFTKIIGYMVDTESKYENIYTIAAPFLIFDSDKAEDMLYNSYLLEGVGKYNSEDDLKKNYLEDYYKLLEKNIDKKDIEESNNTICEDGDDYYWKWAQNFSNNNNNDNSKKNNTNKNDDEKFHYYKKQQQQNNKKDNNKKSSRIDTKDGTFDEVIYKNFLFNCTKIYNNQEPDNNFIYLSYNNTKPEDVYKSFITFYCKRFMQQNDSVSKEDINELIDNIEKNFSIDTKQVLITVPNLYAINSLNVPDMAQNSIKQEENGGIYDTVEDFDANFAKDMKQAQNRQESVILKDKTENLLEKTFTFISTK